MALKQWSACTLILCLGLAGASAVATFARAVGNPQTPPQVQFVTAEELKESLPGTSQSPSSMFARAAISGTAKARSRAPFT